MLAELIFEQRRVPKGFPTDVAKVARRKLAQLNNAARSAISPRRPETAWKPCGVILPANIRSESTTSGGSYSGGAKAGPGRSRS